MKMKRNTWTKFSYISPWEKHQLHMILFFWVNYLQMIHVIGGVKFYNSSNIPNNTTFSKSIQSLNEYWLGNTKDV